MTGGAAVLRLANRLSELAPLRAAVEELVRGTDAPDEEVFEVNVALEEVFCNVVRHGFPEGGEHEIEVSLALADGTLVAVVSDDGVAFDPLGAPAPDLEAPIEERRIGGLGVFLTKSFMDEVSYRREGGRNVLRLARRLPRGR